MFQLIEDAVYISADERRPMDAPLQTLHFVSRRTLPRPEAFVPRPSSVIKDYILSPETYILG